MSILQDLVDRNCPVCGVTYKASAARLKHGRQTTCSRQCSYRLRAFHKTKEKIKLQCPVCLSHFERLESMNKDSQSCYCSPSCAYKGRSLGITKMPKRGKGTYNIKISQKKPVELHCIECNNLFVTIPAKAIRSKFCSKSCCNKHQKKTMLGELNPSWIDGRSYDKRCHRGQDWAEQRQKAYRRDNYTCQHCGVKCVGRNSLTKNNAHRLIQCHHVTHWRESHDNSLENLVTLCVSCHAKVHFGNTDDNEPT